MGGGGWRKRVSKLNELGRQKLEVTYWISTTCKPHRVPSAHVT